MFGNGYDSAARQEKMVLGLTRECMGIVHSRKVV